MMLEDFLETLGHTIHASCDNLADAMNACQVGGFDGALEPEALAGGGFRLTATIPWPP